MVIIRHAKGWSSVYAHGSKLKVRPGQRVLRGQVIALSGASGRVTGPHLHFEMRYGTRATDPEKYLPAPPVESGTLGRVRSPDRARKVASSHH